ncbi:MAG: NAD(P)/FAD-dependent oxidoreductase [Chloroflexota bacterium]|nr:NAD(P)/FAD-dependent oxidoreductase [Chloroflexota bacterium]
MTTEERYDVVIIGAGHNGTSTAAYLAKSGLSVCVLEERPECGGAQENTDCRAGVHISPHAVALYGGAAPGWDQLELWRYGARMDWSAQRLSGEDFASGKMMGLLCKSGVEFASTKDFEGWLTLSGVAHGFCKDLLRATFWCPPHPSYVEVNAETIPFMQVYKERLPEVWTPELMEWTQFDLMDEYMETEAFKVFQSYIAWMSGAAGHMEGMAIPAFESVVACILYTTGAVPQGGIHGFYHAIFRCAVAHGAVFRTCCPVDEIIVKEGRAVGVHLREDASWKNKTIWADKAVISATEIKHTFNELIGPDNVDPALSQRVNDLNIKGGPIYCNYFITKKPLRYREKFKEAEQTGVCYPMDSRELYYNHVADCLGKQGNPSVPYDEIIWLWAGSNKINDPVSHAQCTRPGLYVESSIEFYVPPPEYHTGGPDAMNDENGFSHVNEELKKYFRDAFSCVVENLEEDLVEHLVLTPWEQEYRNTGMLGGSWYGIRHCRDQWWNERPLPEMARYRVPDIDGLYMVHQSAAHPGGLCLMACGYNLMHILIEDGIAEPGDWWYASPWYIPEKGKISAVPGQGRIPD